MTVDLALVHYPILNKSGAVVTTSVTNFDLHDLARTGRTFGIRRVFIITPLEVQRDMVKFITSYWREGVGADFNPDRKEAFSVIEAVPDLATACLTIEKSDGKKPTLVATTAKHRQNAWTYEDLRRRFETDDPTLLIFGTGHGLTEEFLEACDGVLEPIAGRDDYNHLPVRSAVAIILDRLLGQRA